MHDPMTVAFTIPYPWFRRSELFPEGYHDPFITIWHVDPERDGSDDSCDWPGYKRPLNARERAVAEAVWDMEHILDNRPFYPNHEAHREFQKLKAAIRAWRRRSKWRVPVRWHVHHWKFQIHPLQSFKRWAFSRCKWCAKGFAFGDTNVIGYSWNGGGPLWFRSEENIAHMACDRSQGVTVEAGRVG